MSYQLDTTAPDWVEDLPRDHEKQAGKIVDEVGFVQKTGGKEYWKAIQLVELDNEDRVDEIQTRYYRKGDGSGPAPGPAMFPGDTFTELVAFAEDELFETSTNGG